MVQHCAARLITGKTKKDHITPVLMELHWLPVEARIIYKICLLVFKCVNDSAPKYLQDMVIPYSPDIALRSAEKKLLKPWKAKQKRAGERSFAYAAPNLWNKLPYDLKCCESLQIFKTKLKTHLFNEFFK